MSLCALEDSILTEDIGLEGQVCQSEGDPSDKSCRPVEPDVVAPGPASTALEPEPEPLRKPLVALLPAPTAAGVSSPRAAMEQEKRIRREIANSNERRRMQSINAGFQTLRALLPQHEGEKLSKAAILQQTSDFIYSLEQERTRLLTQNCQLKRLLGQEQPDAAAEADAAPAADTSPAAAREKPSHDGAEPAAALPAEERSATPSHAVAMHRELAELQARLEQERHRRLLTEQRLRLVDYTAPPYTPPSHGPPENKQPKLERRAAPEPPLVALQSAAPEPAAPEQALPPPPPPPAPEPEPLPHRPVYFGATTSRQNLDTIVEAIRHLEGDHLFQDLVSPPEQRVRPQEAPLELTTHARSSAALRTESYQYRQS